MYWWDKAAARVGDKKTLRFGLITTNSLGMIFNRQIVSKHLARLSIAFAIPDHPWVDTKDGASVRIAMTVGISGSQSGVLYNVHGEIPTQDGSAEVMLSPSTGKIHADLTIGAETSNAKPLKANVGLSFMGVIPVGTGFLIAAEELIPLGVDQNNLPSVVRHYLNGRDLTAKSRENLIIDFFGLTDVEARQRYPKLFQRVLTHVKPERDRNRDDLFRLKWWLFGRPRPDMRAACVGLKRYIGTTETAKHRTFVFIKSHVLPDQKIRVVASDDAYTIGILSSRIHVTFALAAGGTLEDRPVYNNTSCFDPFPFPACDEATKSRIRASGEELDAHRKRVQAKHLGLSLTAMYNVLEALRAGRALTTKEQAIHDDGLVSILRQLHDELDAAVAAAYGWPDDLSDAEILTRLVALNAERAAEEAAGNIRWLRPDYQAPASGGTQTGFGLAATDAPTAKTKVSKTKTPWPKTLAERVQIIEHALQAAAVPITAASLAKRFSRAKPSEIVEILDTLVILGRANRNEAMFSA